MTRGIREIALPAPKPSRPVRSVLQRAADGPTTHPGCRSASPRVQRGGRRQPATSNALDPERVPVSQVPVNPNGAFVTRSPQTRVRKRAAHGRRGHPRSAVPGTCPRPRRPSAIARPRTCDGRARAGSPRRTRYLRRRERVNNSLTNWPEGAEVRRATRASPPHRDGGRARRPGQRPLRPADRAPRLARRRPEDGQLDGQCRCRCRRHGP